MAEPWKAWKANGRLSPPSTVPWKSRRQREIPTFPQPGRSRLEKWKTKNRFPTFPSHFATASPAFHIQNTAACGRSGRRCAASQTTLQSPNSALNPKRKEPFPGPLHLRFSGSSCIGNESRFQYHLSIGKCYGRAAKQRLPELSNSAWLFIEVMPSAVVGRGARGLQSGDRATPGALVLGLAGWAPHLGNRVKSELLAWGHPVTTRPSLSCGGANRGLPCSIRLGSSPSLPRGFGLVKLPSWPGRRCHPQPQARLADCKTQQTYEHSATLLMPYHEAHNNLNS